MLHGDAVPTVGCAKVWAKLMQCYSWSGLLSTGSTKERSFFLWGASQCKSGSCFCHPFAVPKPGGFCDRITALGKTCLQVFEQLLLHGEQSTLSTFFHLLKWSFNALLAGTWPLKDHNGEEHLGLTISWQ